MGVDLGSFGEVHMTRLLHLGVGFLCVLLTGVAASGQAVTNSAPPSLQAELTTAIKSKSAKPGDAISARTVTALIIAPGQVIPLGSTLRGHVRQVEFASDKPHASLISISFEQAEIPKGPALSLNMTVQAVMMPSASGSQNDGMKTLASPTSGPLPNDHPLSGGAYRLSDTTSTMLKDPASLGHEGITNTNNPAKTSNTKVQAAHAGSVIGMPGVTLEVSDGPDHSSVFRSAKSLELSSGIQLILTVAPNETK